ncbi:acyltransferase [Paraburkholderia sp. MMS20-SJTN17]|uniref:Acyltransferase n=1 Tax=Paraburkholderia translucens TaxID=2886945 RepID=A0ABS8KLY7_9BURK|nr:acyltransferase family protein [Paraburkholderia sp. MMS20-SJTN17]MCC8405774.1 acyltransferase [Paraburkholderia sp. MMS20-SJTN17]
MNFRKDINGVRAIAVTAVVLYHYGIWPFTGGFVGVDIFFVLSGFLLTSIAYADIQAGRFSIWQFLMRRIRRILPALVIMIAFCVLWAGYFYLPDDYMHFSRVATAAILMRSNHAFADDVGYFAPDAAQNLLLHTWSLSVEVQFYIVFAVLCGVVWPRSGSGRRVAGAVLFAAIVVASFAWCQWRTVTSLNSAFYLLPSRAWELLAGSATAVYLRSPRSDAANNLLAIAGLALLSIAIFGLDTASLYPGWRAILPVAGTVLLILSQGGLVAPLLHAHSLQFVGRISYSVYLWHWPLLLAFRERADCAPSFEETIALLGGSILLGWASYELVERPTRKRLGNGQTFAGWVMSICVGFALTAMLGATHGFPQRLPAYLQPAVQAKIVGNPEESLCMRASDGTKKIKMDGDFCRIGVKSGEPTMMLWGDSFAGRLQSTVDDTAAALGLSGIVATHGGCPPFKGKAFDGSGANVFPGCERYANFVYDYFAQHPTIRLVVIAGEWKRYDANYEGMVLRDIARILARRGGRLVLVSAVPHPPEIVPKEWARRQVCVGRAIPEWAAPRDSQSSIFAGGMKITSAAAQVGNVTVVDPFSRLCSRDSCFFVKNNQALFSDGDHLSDVGVKYIAPDIINALKRANDEIIASEGQSGAHS